MPVRMRHVTATSLTVAALVLVPAAEADRPGFAYLSRLGGRAGKSARAQAKQASWYGEPHRFIPIG